jgi:L-cysteine/cystine lyase
MTFAEARAAFPILDRIAYLNTGSNGPIAKATVQALHTGWATAAEEGRSGTPYMDAIVATRDAVRSRVGELLSVPPEHVALTTSTTRGCNIVLAGLGLGPGDEVVTTDSEHFGLLGPLHTSGARVRVAEVRERPAPEALDAILTEISARTRLVALSHVSWQTGHVLPLEELREAVELPILVDGAQSAGAIPVEAASFDFYTVSGQKWLCGPEATGALYVRAPDELRVAAPSYFAQEQYELDGSFVAKEGAARFDVDGLALPSLAALVTAIDAAPDWRFERAAEAASRCRELLLAAGADVVTEAGHATLVSFRPRRPAADVVAAAAAQDVVVRDLPQTPWVRVSCGYWTSDEDLERLVAVL